MSQTGNTTREGYISKTAPTSKSMDFQSMRSLGIETLQKYSGKEWTDYNLHDPGVTILEVLAYAITELGLKVNSPIEDIIASGDGTADLYTPTEILPSLPVTSADYRKLIIDQSLIRNAWIIKHEGSIETDIFYDETTNSLSYSSGSKVKISGFSDVILEFENSSLNTNLQSATVTATSGNSYNLEVVFPYWDEIDSKHQHGLELQSVTVGTVPGTGSAYGVPELKLQNKGGGNYFAVLELSYVGGFTEDFGVHIRVTPQITNSTDRAELLDYIDSTTPGAIVALLTDGASVDSLIQEFLKKANDSKNIISQVKSFLNNYRNLGEDFYSYKTVRTQELGLCADIDLFVGADAETVLSELFFAVHQFISPLIKHKSYDEMIDDGFSVEQLFEGPLLANGFIDSDDLTLGERIDSSTGEIIFYTSDLFNKIKSLNKSVLDDKNHIIDLRNFSLSNYINNQVITEKARNCLKLSLSNIYKPKLSILKSDIRIFKEGIEIDFNINTVLSKFHDLVLADLATVQSHPIENLGVPAGETIDLSSFETIQENFPLTYGIGENGLPAASTDKRKAQAKQLKEYLLLFEQILKNFIAQLTNINALFSYSTTNQRTYFYQLLADIPLLNELVTNTYATQLKNIVEVDHSDAQLARRNNFLNHLVARVGEYNENFGLVFLDSYKSLETKLIDLKKDILTNYPILSSNRFKAYNHALLHADNSPNVWNTENVSGFEKRVCSLLGMKDSRRRNLYNPVSKYFKLYQEADEDAINEQRFRLLDTDDNIILSSITKYTDEEELYRVVDAVIRYGNSRDNYQITVGIDNNYYFRLVDDTDTNIARRIEPFESMTEIETAIEELINFIGFAYGGEAFHVLEHILLRPKIKGATDVLSHRLLPAYYNNDERTVYKDPYSFQMTIIAPSGYIRDFSDENSELKPITGFDRFRDADFRRIFERTLRDEAPAHTLQHIILLDADSSSSTGATPSLNNFERVYKLWLETMANPNSLPDDILTTQRELVELLHKTYNPD